MRSTSEENQTPEWQTGPGEPPVATRWRGIAAILGVTYLLFLFAAVRLYETDRERMVERLREDRLFQVAAAADALQEDVEDVTDDLDFARRHFERIPNLSERRDLLATLVAGSRAYRAIAVYGADGRATTFEHDARMGHVGTSLEEAMAETAKRAVLPDAPEFVASGPVNDPMKVERWYRAFATRLGDEAGAIALLVDTSNLVSALQILSADPQTQILVTGPRGKLVPILSSATVMDPSRTADPEIAEILDRMRRGEAGTAILSPAAAVKLALPPDQVVAAFRTIPVDRGAHWAVGTFTSLSVIRDHERSLMARIATATIGFGALVFGFAWFILAASRRSLILRERLRHAEEITRVNEKADKILETIPTGVVVLRADRALSDMNRAMETIVVDDEHTGPFEDLVTDPVARAQIIDVVDAAMRGERKTVIVDDLELQRRSLGAWAVTGVALDAASDDASALLVFEDLTPVRTLEDQLLRAEKLATIGVLSAGMAHEIGTPLAVIRGRAEFLRDRTPMPEVQRAGLEIIIDQIDRVSRVMHQVLDFTRQKPQAPALSSDLASVVRSVCELLELETRRRYLDIDVQIPPDLPRLTADADQLQQVVLNLVVNALDASPDGSRLEIVAREAQGRGAAVIEIADEGHGIPRGFAHQIFDPFFTTKKRGKGTGLGLAVVAQIVRNHAASITVQSEEGVGTRITLVWPTAAAVAERAAS